MIFRTNATFDFFFASFELPGSPPNIRWGIPGGPKKFPRGEFDILGAEPRNVCKDRSDHRKVEFSQNPMFKYFELSIFAKTGQNSRISVLNVY